MRFTIRKKTKIEKRKCNKEKTKKKKKKRHEPFAIVDNFIA